MRISVLLIKTFEVFEKNEPASAGFFPSVGTFKVSEHLQFVLPRAEVLFCLL